MINAKGLEAMAMRLVKLERMKSICENAGGHIKVSYSGWDGDESVEDGLVVSVKEAIIKIYELEIEQQRKQIQKMVEISSVELTPEV